MRALAHPVRLEILQFLAERGTGTATECAQEAGESPQSCSYHLRALAKYGFVRQVESDDGRETRWQMLTPSLRLGTGVGSQPQRTAAALLQNSLLERDERFVEDYLRNEERFDEEWREAAVFTSGSILVTPAELAALGEQLREALRPYERRGKKGPSNARRVHVALRAVPRIERKKR